MLRGCPKAGVYCSDDVQSSFMGGDVVVCVLYTAGVHQSVLWERCRLTTANLGVNKAVGHCAVHSVGHGSKSVSPHVTSCSCA